MLTGHSTVPDMVAVLAAADTLSAMAISLIGASGYFSQPCIANKNIVSIKIIFFIYYPPLWFVVF